MARTSCRPLRIQAGASVMASSTCWTAGRTAGCDARRRRVAALPGRAGEGEEVVALGVLEVQRVGERVEDALGGAAEAAALHAHVVVDRDAGEHGDLLAAQPCDPTVAAVRRQPGLLGRDPGAAGAEEVTDLRAQVHGGHAPTVGRPARRGWEALAVPGTTVTPAPARTEVDWRTCEPPTCTARATSA